MSVMLARLVMSSPMTQRKITITGSREGSSASQRMKSMNPCIGASFGDEPQIGAVSVPDGSKVRLQDNDLAMVCSADARHPGESGQLALDAVHLFEDGG